MGELWDNLTNFLVGTGGWAYFKIPNMDSLVAYSSVFKFVEVNSTFYQIPKLKTVESWRKRVPKDFEFSVRCNQKLTHELCFSSNPESFKLLEKMQDICQVLKSELLHFQTPPSFEYTKNNCKKVSDFFSSIKKTNLRFVLEPRTRSRLDSNFKQLLQDYDIVHCVDLLKAMKPVYSTDLVYTRLFGKGFHNIYQPNDSELKEVDMAISDENPKKAVITMHGNRMFKDAGRFLIYKKTGDFPQVTNSTGVDSLVEVLKEDAIFPSSKPNLVKHQGWKVIDLTSTKRVHASYFLERLPEKTYYGIQDILQVLGDTRF